MATAAAPFVRDYAALETKSGPKLLTPQNEPGNVDLSYLASLKPNTTFP